MELEAEFVKQYICYAKANNTYMKNFVKSIQSFIAYLGANNLYGWAMSPNLPVNGFKWVKNLSQVNGSFIKITVKAVIKDIFLKQIK